MTDALTQANRIGVLTTPLGEDKLVLSRIDATEGLSQCFAYTIDALSPSKNIDFDDALGKHCTVSVKTHGGQKRHFDGILTEAAFVQEVDIGSNLTAFSYRLVLRPWVWLLSHRADCRIYHQKDVKKIIEDVFERAGFKGDADLRLEESYPELEYCVQYRETDYAFVSRLMEEFGIYYFFEHKEGKHLMVLVDSRSKHQPIQTLEDKNKNKGVIPFRAVARHVQRDEEVLFTWNSGRQFRTGKFALHDYDPQKPDADMKGEAQGTERYEKSKLEIFDYPGRYVEPKVGEKLAKVRLEAEQAGDHRRQAGGDAISLFPGGRINVTGNDADTKKDFVVVSAYHSFSQGVFRSGAEERDTYHGSYDLLPADQQFRAPQITPSPRIYGVQTAKVVADEKAPKDEEIDVDKDGRILVHFFWDRHNERSRRVRIGQPWAHNKWGYIVIPRIGQEVIVDFLEGDPDRPLVTGAVYNGKNEVPYKLPDNKTQSGVKSNSSKGGGGYNEFMFEDKKKSEKIRMHAQKDLEVVVLNNESRSIGYNLDTTVANKEARTVGKNFKPPTGAVSYQTTVKNGDYQLDVESGTILETAKLKIQLKVGPSSITIDPTGITLDAPTITIKAATVCVIQGLPVKIN